MSTLLAVLLVTQTEQSSPILTFAWPTEPRPTLRLDRPVYKHEQSRAGGSDPSVYLESPVLSSQQRSDDRDHQHPGMQFVRGLRPDGGCEDLGDSSSDEALDVLRIPPAVPDHHRSNQSSSRNRGSARRGQSDRRTASMTHLSLRGTEEERGEEEEEEEEEEEKEEEEEEEAGQEEDEDDDDEDHTFPGSFYRNLVNHPTEITEPIIQSGSASLTSYLGFEPDEWADMLTPRALGQGSGTGRKLELVIDALAIIGHPVLINQRPHAATATTPAEGQRGRTRTRSGEKAETTTGASPSSGSLLETRSVVRLEISSPSSRANDDHHDNNDNDGNQRALARVAELDRTELTDDGLSNRLSVLELGEATNLTPTRSSCSSSHLNSRLELDQPTPIVDQILLSPSPSKPPTAQISQLTRMLITPSNLLPIESNSNPFFFEPQSIIPHSIRSTSSPSPGPSSTIQRFQYNPVEPSNKPKLNPYHQPMLNYSPIQLTHAAASTATLMDDPDRPPVPASSDQLIPLESFTLALVIDTPPASHLSQHLEVYYRDVVLKLTAALKHLERQNGYLTREAHAIARVHSNRRESNSSVSTSPSKRIGTKQIIKTVQRSSDLARALARVFDDLRTTGSTSITLDRQLDLELLLHYELFDGQPTTPDHWLGTNNVLRSQLPQSLDPDRFAHLESWKSLILLEDSQVLMEQTPTHSLLRDFVAIIKPTLTLSEYKILLDTDSHTIAEMTDHLLYWKKAKLTDMITLRNSYRLACPLPADSANPVANTLPIGNLRSEFGMNFPNLPHLVLILSLISKRPRQPFSDILPALDPNLEKSESMAVLVWLLKRDLVLRERTYVRVKVDRETKKTVFRQQKRTKKRKKQKKEKVGGSEDDGREGTDALSQSLSSGSRPGPDSRRLERDRLPTGLLPVPAGYPKPETIRLHERNNTASDPSLRSLTSISASTQHRFGIATESRLIDRSGSDRSGQASINPNQQLLESGSADSVVSLGELRRRQSRRFRQRSFQSGFMNLSDENIEEESDEVNNEDEDEESDEDDRQEEEEEGEEEMIGEPGMATILERKWLKEMCRDKTEAQISSFNLVLRYFNGRYPLEEIMSRSDLNRRSLQEVLLAFKKNLILLIHP